MENNLQLLLRIDNELNSTEVASLKFLCSDVVGKKHLEMIQGDANDLFVRLNEQDLMNGDMMFLQELLYTINRFDLLRHMGSSEQHVLTSLQKGREFYDGLSAYRKMLFDVAENMTSEKLSSFKFLVNLPRGKLEASATILDVFTEMEKQQQLTEDDVEKLERILNQCDKQLAGKVEEYRLKKTGDTSRHEQENNLLPESMKNLSVETHSGEDYQNLPRSRGQSVVSDAGPVINDDDSYPMNSKPRGICLIINNDKFHHHPNRKGTDKDKDELQRVFEWLHFTVNVKTDLTAQDMELVVQEYANRSHSAYDALVVCVLSHGTEGTVLGVDGEPVLIKQLYRPFTACRTLTGKPKLFFIQACQGVEYQKGQIVEDGPNEQLGERFEEDALNPMLHKTSVAAEADVLIGMSTVEEFKSFRHTTFGSIYIQALCRALESGCPKKEDLHAILTRVNNEISKCDYNTHKQMPQPKYTLTRKLVLPVD